MDKYLKSSTEVIHVRLNITESSKKVYKKFKKTFKKFIVGHEVNHYHVMLVVKKRDEWIKGTKYNKLRSWIKDNFDVKGNGMYSIKPARLPKQLSKYVVKDGNYKQNGFSDKELKVFVLCSNQKGKDKLKQSLTKLEERFFSDEIGIVDFYEGFIKLKVSYGQTIYPNHTDAYVMKLYFKKFPNAIQEFVSVRIGNMNMISHDV